ncbi:MAG: hypothetical protein JW795_15395 [Chitinivibrionales bacterium]|nr:hypothetical protein [Chitinivibrionales bacterium]
MRNVTDEKFLSDDEWNVLYLKTNRSGKVPKKMPTVKQCVRWFAQLGGFLARKNDKEPGITHVWRGLKRFLAILNGITLSKKLR